MSDGPYTESALLDAWTRNAPAWISAVRDGRIESRRQVTDAAIMDAVLSRSPERVLDLGCGEGWLARELAARKLHTTGVDAVPEFIEAARRAGGGEFHVVDYESIAGGGFRLAVDAVICNFSLLGRESTEAVMGAIPPLLNPGGVLVVQTLHPVVACGDQPYRDGWRAGSWIGCGTGFGDAAPWYFRTLEGWMRLFSDSGFQVQELREPVHPETLRPASVIFVAAPR